jgi:hypothetical protein
MRGKTYDSKGLPRVSRNARKSLKRFSMFLSENVQEIRFSYDDFNVWDSDRRKPGLASGSCVYLGSQNKTKTMICQVDHSNDKVG